MPLNKGHILYVEDHEDTRELVVLVLQQQNYDVTTSASIEDAVELASESKYDLYLLDSWLPDGSGLDLCRRIREFDMRTPILFYSAAAYEVDRELALRSGAQAYLVKPTLNSELCDVVSFLIESATARRIAV
jgi:two-component system, OmpR family, response regulator